MCNPCAAKKPTMADDGLPKPGLLKRIKSSRPILVLIILQSIYTLSLAVNAYLSIGVNSIFLFCLFVFFVVLFIFVFVFWPCCIHYSQNTPFEQFVGVPTSGLYGPTYERLDYPKSFGPLESYDLWVANKPSTDQWLYANFMGVSSLRACSMETDADAWAAKIVGAGQKYADWADVSFLMFVLLSSCFLLDPASLIFFSFSYRFLLTLSCIFLLSSNKNILASVHVNRKNW